MRRRGVVLAIATTVLVGCTRPISTERSAVFRQFSLDAAVARVSVPQLRPTHASSGETNSIEQLPRKEFSLVFAIDGTAPFDETGFIKGLGAEIWRTVEASGGRVQGGGPSNGQINLDYTVDGRLGWIEVFGARTEGNQYRLWGVLREGAAAPARN